MKENQEEFDFVKTKLDTEWVRWFALRVDKNQKHSNMQKKNESKDETLWLNDEKAFMEFYFPQWDVIL